MVDQLYFFSRMDETYKLICPNGSDSVLIFSKDQLINNPFVKGTLMDKVFFSNPLSQNDPLSQNNTSMKNKNTIHLTWEYKIVMLLIPLIRDGTIYNVENTKDKKELIKLLDYLGGDNLIWKERHDALIY